MLVLQGKNGTILIKIVNLIEIDLFCSFIEGIFDPEINELKLKYLGFLPKPFYFS